MNEDKDQNQKKKKRGFGFVLKILILCVAAGVFIYAAWQLYSIYHGYAAASSEYDSIKDEYTTPYSETSSVPDSSGATSPTTSSDTTSSNADSGELIEDAAPPLEVNFAQLQSVNPDVVGWLYVDALPNISYPICRGTDNDYYLHHTFEKKSLFAGSIFMDFNNAADFSDPNTIVYGHNMKNQSMFGLLKLLREQATYDANPYFWILTPQGTYRYHIYAAFETAVNSHAYYLYDNKGAEFLTWEMEMQSNSEVTNSVPLSENDNTVMLSTCTSNSETRTVVLGKCVSTQRP